MSVDSFIRHYLRAYRPYQTDWNDEDGCVLMGCQQMFEATGDPLYRAFILDYLAERIAADGIVTNFPDKGYDTGDLNLSKMLFFAYDQTGEERYRKALDFFWKRLEDHPRCQSSSFWHKTIDPNQVWLDDLYMVMPFYMQYDTAYSNREHYRDILFQFQNVRRYMFDKKKDSAYHGWDETRKQPWSDPKTGCSKNLWLRGLGWYAMALVDTVSFCDPLIYVVYVALTKHLDAAVYGLIRYQDRESKLLYQVMDKPEAEGNYLETSGTAMVAYTLLKGSRMGVIPAQLYLPYGLEMMEALIQQKLVTIDGKEHLKDICAEADLGSGAHRDGSVAYYLSQKIVSDDAKGVGPFMMAYAQYLMTKRDEAENR